MKLRSISIGLTLILFVRFALILGWGQQDLPPTKAKAQTPESIILESKIQQDLALVLHDMERISQTSVDGSTSHVIMRLDRNEKCAISASEVAQVIKLLHTYRNSELVPRSQYSSYVTRLLIHLGDPAEIKHATRALVDGSTLDKFKLPGVLAKSRRAEVVTALKDIIAINESIQERLEGGEFSISPASVAATYIINQILVESDQFSSIMQAWAQSLQRVKIEKRREVIRKWWNVNRELLDAGHYEETRPLSEKEQEIKREDYYPDTKAVRIPN